MSDLILTTERTAEIRKTIPEGVTLVAVSKYHPAGAVQAAYDAGQRHFGESRVQELAEKVKVLPDDIKWHFIGHLQTNKVRKLIGLPYIIESIDTERLLELVDSESRRVNVTTNVLLQLHVAAEETKFGFSVEEMTDYFRQRKFEGLTNTHICGLMGMASNTDDITRIDADFKLIADTFNRIRTEIAPDLRGFDTLSMGMSHDYHRAINMGSTEVRIGTAIFGQREY